MRHPKYEHYKYCYMIPPLIFIFDKALCRYWCCVGTMFSNGYWAAKHTPLYSSCSTIINNSILSNWVDCNSCLDSLLIVLVELQRFFRRNRSINRAYSKDYSCKTSALLRQVGRSTRQKQRVLQKFTPRSETPTTALSYFTSLWSTTDEESEVVAIAYLPGMFLFQPMLSMIALRWHPVMGQLHSFCS